MVLLALLVTGCAAPPWLIRLGDAPGEACPEGGVAVFAGADDDGDGVLDDPEIQEIQFLCDGTTGPDVLVRLEDEPAGDSCAHGGVALHAGGDANGDGVLGDDEIEATRLVCHGPGGTLDLATVQGTYHLHNSLDLALIEGVTAIEGALVLDTDAITAIDLPGLQHLGAFPAEDCRGLERLALPSIAQLEGSIALANCPALTDVDLGGLTAVGGDATFDGLDSLETLALPALEQVGGALAVEDLGALTALDVSALREVGGDATFDDLGALPALDLALEEVGGTLRLVRVAAPAAPDLVEVGGSLRADEVTGIDAFGWLGALQAVGTDSEGEAGGLFLEATSALDLQGLEGVSDVPGAVIVADHADLATLDGLDGLRTVGALLIEDNASLDDVGAAEGTTSVTLHLLIRNNPTLPTCAAEAVRDAIGTENIGGSVVITGNDDEGSCE